MTEFDALYARLTARLRTHEARGRLAQAVELRAVLKIMRERIKP